MTNQFTYIIIACLCLVLRNAGAQQNQAIASRISEKIIIDGSLNEVAWASTETYSDFTNFAPNPGTKAKTPTVTHFIYDDNALYVGAFMKTESSDDISQQVTERDGVGQSDAISIIIDTYKNAT